MTLSTINNSVISWTRTGTAIASDLAIKSLPIISKIGLVAAKVLFIYYPLYSLLESSLSNILCLKTFRHGTSPNVIARICIEGPDLSRGGIGGEANYFQSVLGVASPYAHRDKDCFYVVEDVISSKENKNPFKFMFHYFVTKMTVKYYSLRTSCTYYISWLPMPAKWKAGLTSCTIHVVESDPRIATLFSLIAPSVKFHLDPAKVTVISNREALPSDEGQNGQAYFARDGLDSMENNSFEGSLVTRHQFSVLDIGVIGVLKNGLNLSLPKRIWENKGQCLWGVAQLVCCVALFALMHPALIPGGTAIVGVFTYVSVRAVYSTMWEIVASIFFLPVIMTALET